MYNIVVVSREGFVFKNSYTTFPTRDTVVSDITMSFKFGDTLTPRELQSIQSLTAIVKTVVWPADVRAYRMELAYDGTVLLGRVIFTVNRL